MRKITLIVVLLLLVSYLIAVFALTFVPHAHGKEADTSMRCNTPLMSQSMTSSEETKTVSQALTVVSECKMLRISEVEGLSSALNNSIAEWREMFSNSPTIKAHTLYGYTMTVSNDRDIEINFNLSGWEFIHSPYTLMWEGFSYRIPACSKMRVGFISPNAPEYADVSINVMHQHNERLVTEGDGRMTVIIPSYPGLHHPGTVSVSSLSSDKVESEGCKKK